MDKRKCPHPLSPNADIELTYEGAYLEINGELSGCAGEEGVSERSEDKKVKGVCFLNFT